MPNSTHSQLSGCVIAFDLDQQKHLTVGPCINILMGNVITDSANFWYDIIHPDDIRDVELANNTLLNRQNITTTYRLVPHNNNTEAIYITEKRSIYTDGVTGNRIQLSILDQIENNADSDVALPQPNHEQYLLGLINSQTNFLIRLSTEGYFTFVNQQFCNAFGYTEQEIIGQYFSFMTDPAEMSLCEWAFVNTLHNPGKIITLTHNKIDKQGNRHPTEWEFISITDDSGKITGLQGVGRDISHHLEVEQQVIRSAERLDHFIESITDCFFIVDTDWRFIKTNSTFERVSGKHRSELLGANLWEAFSWINGTGFERNFRQAAALQKTLKFTEYIPFSKMWFRTTIYPSAEGLTVFMKNITSQKQAEEELQWTQKKLESLINNTEDLIWSIDPNGNYIYINNAYKQHVKRSTGLAPANGLPVNYSTYQNNANERWQVFYKRAFASERFVITEELTDPVTDEPLCFEVSFNPIFKESGEVTGVGCFARDITSRLKTEKAIRNQNDRLRQIASLSSHELRRPVASMLGLINIIDFENFNNPDNKEVISFLLTVSREIDEVIKLIVDNTFTGKPV